MAEETTVGNAPARKVADYKTKTVAEFCKLIEEYPNVGSVNMENLPTPQLQKMRAQLRGKVVIKVAKRRIIKQAIEQSKSKKKGLEKLEPYLNGMPGLLFTKDNPFTLFKTLKKSKSSAPAKAGQTAPNDIIVTAGPTPFAPGPIIGELGALGLKTSIENGKVAVKQDSVVVKEGEVIKAKVAEVLTRLGIQPMEIGLNLIAVYEDGNILTKDILDIDEDAYKENITKASTWAFNLAIEVAYPCKETTEILVAKAFNDSKALALEQNILADAVVEQLISKAESQAAGLKKELNLPDVVEKKMEEPMTEAIQAEEKTAEAPTEEPAAEEKSAEPAQEEKAKEEPKEKPEEPAPAAEKKEENQNPS